MLIFVVAGFLDKPSVTLQGCRAANPTEHSDRAGNRIANAYIRSGRITNPTEQANPTEQKQANPTEQKSDRTGNPTERRMIFAEMIIRNLPITA